MKMTNPNLGQHKTAEHCHPTHAHCNQSSQNTDFRFTRPYDWILYFIHFIKDGQEKMFSLFSLFSKFSSFILFPILLSLILRKGLILSQSRQKNYIFIPNEILSFLPNSDFKSTYFNDWKRDLISNAILLIFVIELENTSTG